MSAAAAAAPSAMEAASVRATVRWGRNGRPSGGQPSASSGASRAAVIAASSLAPCSIPIHRARGRPALGNAPAPASRAENAAVPRAAVRTASTIAGTRSGAVAPRKRSVRWRFSVRTHLAPRPAGPRRTPSISPRHASSASVGTGTATNNRYGLSATVLARVTLPVARQHLERPVALAPAHDVHRLVLEQLVGVEE